MALKLLIKNYCQVTKNLEDLDKEKYSLKEVSEVVGIDIKKLQKELRIGRIKGTKEKGKWFISRDTLFYTYFSEKNRTYPFRNKRYAKRLGIKSKDSSLIYFSPSSPWREIFYNQQHEPQLIYAELNDESNKIYTYVQTDEFDVSSCTFESATNALIDIGMASTTLSKMSEKEVIRMAKALLWDGTYKKTKNYTIAHEPYNDHKFYVYKNHLYCFDALDIHTIEEQKLLIKQHFFRQEKKFAKLKKEIKLLEKLESMQIQQSREPIPEDVRFAVWRRDKGKCVKCGSNKNLEFDHIIPVSKGGSSTERNIQILCETCNRQKSDKI